MAVPSVEINSELNFSYFFYLLVFCHKHVLKNLLRSLNETFPRQSRAFLLSQIDLHHTLKEHIELKFYCLLF